MSIPCTGKVEGIASLLITMYIKNYYGHLIRGSPLRLRLKKRCNKFGKYYFIIYFSLIIIIHSHFFVILVQYRYFNMYL